MAAESPQSELRLPSALDDSLLRGARVLARLGEGKRSMAYRVQWQGRECVVKVYAPAAAAKHAQRHRVALARFEYQRNLALYRAPGLAAHVARPLAYLADGPQQAFVQEFVSGTLFEHFRVGADPLHIAALLDSLPSLIDRAHAAGIYDLDLHPNNVMVADDGRGGVMFKLFDFNKIPFHERSPNPLSWLLLRLGLIRPASRDRRRMHLFTDPPGRNRLGTRRQ
ncbi:MAG: hypothetical protein ACT4PG_05375 [Panacagrimonas sp.]